MRFVKLILFILFFLHALTLSAQEVRVETAYLIDTQSTYSVDTIYEAKGRFTPFKPHENNFGLQDATVWIYVKVENLTDDNLAEVIQFEYPLLDYIHMREYLDGEMVLGYLTGDMTLFESRAIKTNDFVVPYTLAPQQSKEFIFKINSEGALNLGMKFVSHKDFDEEVKSKLLVLGGYYGAVVIMLLYNFVLFLMIREKVYLDYVVFHLTYLFLQIGLNGIGFEYLWPTLPEINTLFVPIFLAAANYFSIQFTLSFLEIKHRHPKFYRYFKTLMTLFAIEFVLVFFLPYSIIVKAIGMLSMLSVISIFVLGLYLLYKERSMSAKFFVTAWSFLAVGVLFTEFQNFGLLPMSALTLYGSQIGAFFELALLAFALAYRYNILFTKLQKTESSLRTLNRELEQKVQERMQNLDEKNRELSYEVKGKNVLLRELYHRVKNNLQIISGLLSLQTRRIKDETALTIFNETNQRIRAMSLIHETLFQTDNIEFIQMQSYIEKLSKGLRQSFQQEDVSFDIHCDTIRLGLESAVPMGLIINELVTNAIKYAFDAESKEKKIVIKMYVQENRALVLEVFDTGKGADLATLKKGFGFQLLQSLASYQLQGKHVIFNDAGLHHKIVFAKELLK